MLPRFERFIKERRFLKNVSTRTIEWYEQSLAWLNVEEPTAGDVKDLVVRMREAGLKASSCNCHIRAINGYLHWAAKGSEQKCHPACEHVRVPKLKEEEYVPATYSGKQIASILAWKPRLKKFYERRLHALMLALFDCGMRIDEALSLRVQDCNLDDMLFTVTGKGRKQRIIPFSLELRRVLAKYIIDFGKKLHDYLFATRQGRKLSRRNVLREVKRLCARLGFKAPARTVHATRHTFSIEYLRRGGNLFHLQKMLGHTSLEQVRKYANLVTADLQAVHQRVSLLQKAC